jgi:hypothetical protein
LSEDEVLKLLELLADKTADATEEFVEGFMSQYGNPNTQDLRERFQEGMIELSEK